MHLDKCYSKATLNEKENVKNVELPKKEKLFTCCGGMRETFSEMIIVMITRKIEKVLQQLLMYNIDDIHLHLKPEATNGSIYQI